jgi:hypothetical protein
MNRAMRAGMVALTLILAALMSSCAVQSLSGTRIAFVYGINVQNSQYSSDNLNYCVADATSMKTLLEASGFTVTIRTDAAATKANMLSDIASLGSDVTAFAFYYSGHGYKSSSSQTNGYICPYGSIGNTGNLVSGAMLSVSELQTAVKAVPVFQKTIILDSCYSGSFVSDGSAADLSPGDYSPGSTASGEHVSSDPASVIAAAVSASANYQAPGDSALYITAAGWNEVSIEGGGHGYFTAWLLKASAYGDANLDGWVSAAEAVAYAYKGLIGSEDFLCHISAASYDWALFKSQTSPPD